MLAGFRCLTGLCSVALFLVYELGVWFSFGIVVSLAYAGLYVGFLDLV